MNCVQLPVPSRVSNEVTLLTEVREPPSAFTDESVDATAEGPLDDYKRILLTAQQVRTRNAEQIAKLADPLRSHDEKVKAPVR